MSRLCVFFGGVCVCLGCAIAGIGGGSVLNGVKEFKDPRG